MTRMLFVLLVVTACAACAAGAASGQKQVVPQALIGVEFKGMDTAPVTSMTPARAAALKDKVEAEHKDHYTEEGHSAWFFHAFDSRHLYFFVARYHVECENMLGCLEYIVEKMIRVPRTAAALEKLEVKDTVDLYEKGVQGIRGGMSRDEVEAVMGEPESEEPLQLFGSFRLHYPGLDVTFYGEAVLSVQETGGH
jgi:hypothetical protein